MVDDSRTCRLKVRTLSESSRSDASESLNEDCYEQPRRNAVSERNCFRQLVDGDPELYGVRRSSRCRKDPMHGQKFTYENESEEVYVRKRRVVTFDNSESSYSNDSSYEERSISRNRRQGRKSIRTRGNRVNYKSAFTEDLLSESQDGSSDERPIKVNSQVTQDKVKQLQNPKGSLIREPVIKRAKAELDYTSDRAIEEELPVRSDISNEDCDVIEEVLTHDIRRLGATGNSSTMYNCRLESDPNEGFDSTEERGEVQYLIKWKNWSHIHCTWESETSLEAPDRGTLVTGLKKLHIYKDIVRKTDRIKQYANPDKLDEIIYEEERQKANLMKKMLVERIVAHSRDSESDCFDYLVKWQQLEYRHCTWESGRVIKELFPDSILEYKNRNQNIKQPSLKHEALRIRPKFSRLLEQPDYIGDNNANLKLREYQLNGLNWIAHAWTRGNSVILADEMGLGKTIQTVSFFSYLFNEHGLYGPFLLVVPLSTVSNWTKELRLWAPYMNTIVYSGDPVSRQLIREHEWSSSSRRNQNLKFNVCITTYELLLNDKAWLSSVPWAVLSVDEAHRLKNDQSLLYKDLFTFNTNCRLLVTGTPLQNSLKELWALLHFIMPNEFEDWEQFEEDYTSENDESKDAFKKLHRVLEPYLLRRVKRDVEYSLPAKIERVLRVEMTPEQAEVYRLILARNYDGLMRVTNGHKASFVNIVMELKKCCNHAYLIAPPNDNKIYSIADRLNNLVRGSGKLLLLDKLLLKLKPKGHRVLIFSQMVRMLDVIADYLDLRGWGYQRLDGSVSGEARKQSLDHFNADGSTDFCFLLSTRAGGLGINLATADVVVIFDSDWNPQNDLQAQARAHRIGQTKQVSVYRLVTKDSIEEKIIESATRKMVLDHLVIQRMDSGGGASSKKVDTRGKLYSDILKYGAESLFKSDLGAKDNHDVDIDDILSRAETRDCADEMPANHPANALLSTFNVVNVDKLEETEPVMMDQSAKSAAPVKAWSDIIPETMRLQVKEEVQADQLIKLELGPRMRKKVNTYQAGVEDESDDSSENNLKTSSDFTDKEVRNLVKSIKRFPKPLTRIDSIMADAELPDKSEDEVRSYIENILNGCKMMMEASSATEGSKVTYTLGKVSIPVKALLQTVEDLEILSNFFPESKEERLKIELPFNPKCVNWNCIWSDIDDVKLLAGVYEHGYDNWESIKLDVDLGLGSKLLPINGADRPQATHIKTRVDYLLKTLHKSSKGEDVKSETTKQDSKKKLKSRTVKKESHLENVCKLKSAEFVESDGTSSDDNQEVVQESTDKSRKRSSRKIKSRTVDNAKRTKVEEKTGPMHFTAHKEPVPIRREEEKDFREMKGPLFDKCKKKMHPVKKTLQQLEKLEDEAEDSGPQFDSVVAKIGEHIRSVVKDVEDKEERHKWRKFLWEFVGIFSEKTADQLQECYKKAHKHHHHHHNHHKEKDREKESNILSDADLSAKYSKHKKHKHDSNEKHNYSKDERRYDWISTSNSGPRVNGRNSDRFDNAFNRCPGNLINSSRDNQNSFSRSHFQSSSRRSKHYSGGDTNISNSSGVQSSSHRQPGNNFTHNKSYYPNASGRSASNNYASGYSGYYGSNEKSSYASEYSSSGNDFEGGGNSVRDNSIVRQQHPQVISTIHSNRDPRLAHGTSNTHNLSSTRCD